MVDDTSAAQGEPSALRIALPTSSEGNRAIDAAENDALWLEVIAAYLQGDRRAFEYFGGVPAITVLDQLRRTVRNRVPWTTAHRHMRAGPLVSLTNDESKYRSGVADLLEHAVTE